MQSGDFDVCYLFSRNNVDKFGHFERAVESGSFALVKFHLSGNQGEESIIFPSFNVFARMNFGAPLANQHGSSLDHLPVTNFGTEILGVGVSAQPGRPTRFLVCHTIIAHLSCPVCPP